jgi:hypothetical protein
MNANERTSPHLQLTPRETYSGPLSVDARELEALLDESR